MTKHVEVMELVAQLKAAEEAFVLATVVRTVSVTAAKAGAKAIIRPDGKIVAGWIGAARLAAQLRPRHHRADEQLVGVLRRDTRLIIVAIERPGLDLAAVELAVAHQVMEGVLVVVALGANRAQLGFELLGREQRCGHSLTSIPS